MSVQDDAFLKVFEAKRRGLQVTGGTSNLLGPRDLDNSNRATGRNREDRHPLSNEKEEA